jgi:hypothetical protein
MRFERRFTLNRCMKFLALALVFVLVSCGGNSSESTAIPTPVDPTAGGNNLTTPGQVTNADLVEFQKAAALRLTTPTDYSGILDLFPAFTAPLVSNALVLWYVNLKQDGTVTGRLKLGEEDRLGFYIRKWEASFPGTGVKTSNTFDLIYSDTQATVRVSGSFSTGDALNGVINYRLRQSGETQCQQVVWTCMPAGSTCTLPPDTSAQDCKNYMSSGTKTLGTFVGSFATSVSTSN